MFQWFQPAFWGYGFFSTLIFPFLKSLFLSCGFEDLCKPFQQGQGGRQFNLEARVQNGALPRSSSILGCGISFPGKSILLSFTCIALVRKGRGKAADVCTMHHFGLIAWRRGRPSRGDRWRGLLERGSSFYSSSSSISKVTEREK